MSPVHLPLGHVTLQAMPGGQVQPVEQSISQTLPAHPLRQPEGQTKASGARGLSGVKSLPGLLSTDRSCPRSAGASWPLSGPRSAETSGPTSAGASGPSSGTVVSRVRSAGALFPGGRP